LLFHIVSVEFYADFVFPHKSESTPSRLVIVIISSVLTIFRLQFLVPGFGLLLRMTLWLAIAVPKLNS